MNSREGEQQELIDDFSTSIAYVRRITLTYNKLSGSNMTLRTNVQDLNMAMVAPNQPHQKKPSDDYLYLQSYVDTIMKAIMGHRTLVVSV